MSTLTDLMLPQASSQPHYPIRTVAQLTGVNPITLRAWERRYNLLKPVRTAKGHRLYSQQDVDLILQVLELLKKGIPISQARQTLKEYDTTTTTLTTSTVWAEYRQAMITAITHFDEQALESTYNKMLSLHPIEIVTQQLIVPLWHTLLERREITEGAIAEEHFFATFLRNKLGARFHHRLNRTSYPSIVFACLPEEQHDISLLALALAVQTQGYSTVILGTNLPLKELSVAVKRSKSQAIVLWGDVSNCLSKLVIDLPLLIYKSRVPIFIGGRFSVRHHNDIMRLSAIPLGEEVSHALSTITTYLRKLSEKDEK